MVGKYIRPQNCAFSDILGPDLTRRVLALCMGIAICDRQKFGQVWTVWGSPAPLPEFAGKLQCRKAPLWTFDYHVENSESFCDVTSGLVVGWSPEGTFKGVLYRENRPKYEKWAILTPRSSATVRRIKKLPNFGNSLALGLQRAVISLCSASLDL